MQHLSHSRCLIALLSASVLGLAACGGGQSSGPSAPRILQYEVDVKLTQQGSGDPIVGYPILLDGKTVGYTDRDGRFRGVIKDKHRTEVLLELGEDERWRRLTDHEYVVLAELEAKLNQKKDAVLTTPLMLHTSLASNEVDHLVWISTSCPDGKLCDGLPITAAGEVVATTDIDGRAHFVHTGPPGKTLDVRIDTSDTNLAPASPRYAIELNSISEVYAIREAFAEGEEVELAAVEEPEPVKKKPRSRRTKRDRKKPTVEKKPSTRKKDIPLVTRKPKPEVKKPVAKKPVAEKPKPKPKPKPKNTEKGSGSTDDPISLF